MTHPFTAEADQPSNKILHNADGSIEFKCEGCGMDVFCAVDDGFGFPACMECRWFGERPQIRVGIQSSAATPEFGVVMRRLSDKILTAIDDGQFDPAKLLGH